MLLEREHAVTLFMAIIALLVIIGGYASLSGLAAYQETLRIELSKESFSQSDIFDATVVMTPVTLMADDSMMIYLDGNAVGVLAIKKYLDDNLIEYGSEMKNLGENNVEILTLKSRLLLNLADYVTLEHMSPGTAHTVTVELSRGDASAQAMFRIK